MIKITTDSTCDLPAELLTKYDISVTPLGVVMGDHLYQDGVNITTADIAAHVDAGGGITTTNAVNAADYETLFRELIAQYDAVIHINIGAGFSCCHQNAKLAAEEGRAVAAGEEIDDEDVALELERSLALLQDKYFTQCEATARALGLNITSRCKLVIPQEPPVPKSNKFERFRKQAEGE